MSKKKRQARARNRRTEFYGMPASPLFDIESQPEDPSFDIESRASVIQNYGTVGERRKAREQRELTDPKEIDGTVAIAAGNAGKAALGSEVVVPGFAEGFTGISRDNRIDNDRKR